MNKNAGDTVSAVSLFFIWEYIDSLWGVTPGEGSCPIFCDFYRMLRIPKYSVGYAVAPDGRET